MKTEQTPLLKLGLGSYAFAWSIGVPGKTPRDPMIPFGLIDEAARLGVFAVQIDDNLSLHHYSEDELEQIIHYARARSITLEVGAKRLSRDHALACLDIAEACGSPFLRMVVDDGAYQPGIEEVMGILKDIAPEFERRRIPLAIENHDRFRALTFRRIIEETGSDFVKICLDSVNSIGAGEGLETVTEILAPYAVNLHLKDFEARRLLHKMGFMIEGKPLGQGQLPIAWLLDKMPAACRSATLELWPPEEETLEATIAKERRWVEESVQYWKENFENI